jgi:hypothetical protein
LRQRAGAVTFLAMRIAPNLFSYFAGFPLAGARGSCMR